MFRKPGAAELIEQGDIIDGCPFLVWNEIEAGRYQAAELQGRILVLTQSCDLANAKATRVVTAIVHSVRKLVDAEILKPRVIEDQVRLHRVFGWYFLPASEYLEESIVDLRDLQTIPRRVIEELVSNGMRTCRIESPYREHLAQKFAITYSRIALPEPYPTIEE